MTKKSVSFIMNRKISRILFHFTDSAQAGNSRLICGKKTEDGKLTNKKKLYTAMPGRHFSLCTEKSLSGIFSREPIAGGKEGK